jgi:hypothetical protein
MRMGFDKLVGVEARLLRTPALVHTPIDEDPVVHKITLEASLYLIILPTDSAKDPK